MLGMRPRLWLPCMGLQACKDGTFDTGPRTDDTSPSCAILEPPFGELLKCLPCFPMQVVYLWWCVLTTMAATRREMECSHY